MTTPFTELALHNISANDSAFLAYDNDQGFRLFQEVVDGIASYYKDITSVSPPDATYTLGNGVTVLGSKITIDNTPVSAGSFVVGRYYKIVAVGTTDFTAIGASANTVGVWFKASGVGTGTGTAKSDFSLLINEVGQVIKVNGTWCKINQYISETNIIVDRITTGGLLVFPSFYPNVIEETIIGKISVISADATTVVVGQTYQVLDTGTTNFTLAGAANSDPGTQFTATATLTGTGTVTYYTIERYFTSLSSTGTGSITVSGTYVGETRTDAANLMYIWTGLEWAPTGTGASSVIVSETAPSSPSEGTLWQRPSDSRLFLWNGTEWVQSIPGTSGTQIVDTTTVDGSYDNETVIDSTDGNLYKWNAGLGVWEVVLENLLVDLSNQAHVCASAFDGTSPDLTGAETQINVFSGGANVTSLWTITKAESADITGTLSYVGPHSLYVVTTLTADAAYVDFTLTRAGFADRIVRFSVSKVRAGEGGVGYVYRIQPNVSSFIYSNGGVYAPTTITLEAYQTLGTGTPALYSGRFKIYYSTNGLSYTLDYTSSSDESSKTYTPSVANIKFIKTELYLAGGTTTLVDLENVPVIPDGAQGTTGIQGNPGLQGGTGSTGPQGLQGGSGPTGQQGITGTVGTQGLQGGSGPTGQQGITGTVGAQGLQGGSGPTGQQGITGTVGAQGLQGGSGPTGQQGITGTLGAQGAAGTQGPLGQQGTTGPLGSQGGTGTQGPLGQQGTVGFAGPSGAQGTTGPTGVQGNPGTAGAQGLQGGSGPTGQQGTVGTTGAQGAQGNLGPTGQQGITGTTGAQGAQGASGGQGRQGSLGPTGSQGAQGTSGGQGQQGTIGFAGPAGAQGTTGPTGTQGNVGSLGPTGPQGTSGPSGPGGAAGPAGSTGPQGASLFAYYSSAPITVLNTFPTPTLWVSGATYAFNAVVYYNSKIYAMQTIGGITGVATVPSSDTTNWLQVFANGSAIGSVVTGGSFVIGVQYRILTVGGTSFTSIGASANTVGTYFTATGTGAGITGTAETLIHTAITPTIYVPGESRFRCVDNTYYFYVNATQVSGGATAVKWVIYATEINSANIGTEDFGSPILSIGETGATGATGPTGAAGAQGPNGVQGNVGPNGPQGTAGTQGAQGGQGTVGNTGSQGTAGTQGSQGRQGTGGIDGIQGTAGTQGAQGGQGTGGFAGSQGSTGTQGAQGRQGNTGAQGNQGTIGTQGAQGQQGNVGSQGNQGTIGTQGAQGQQGTGGAQGQQGTVGTQGAQGGQGTGGATGSQGITGTQGGQGGQGTGGFAGSQGSAGTQGAQGRQGTGGLDGAQGTAGTQGAQGRQGTGGLDGAQGTAGTQGAQGRQGTGGQDGAQGSAGTQGAQGRQGTGGLDGAQGTAGTQGAQGRQGVLGATGSQGVTGSQGGAGAQGGAGSQGPLGAQGLSGPNGPTGGTGSTGPTGPAGSAGNAVAFDVLGTYNNDTGANSRADYIRLYRATSLVKNGDVYWNVTNGEVWQWQGSDDTSGSDLTLTKLTGWIARDSLVGGSPPKILTLTLSSDYVGTHSAIFNFTSSPSVVSISNGTAPYTYAWAIVDATSTPTTFINTSTATCTITKNSIAAAAEYVGTLMVTVLDSAGNTAVAFWEWSETSTI